MIRKSLMILFITFSNTCSAVLTPEELAKTIEAIFEDTLGVMTDYVGLKPAPKFLETGIEENVRIFDNIGRLCDIFIDSLNLLSTQQCSIPRSVEELRAKSIEEKKLYRALSTIFSCLIITRIFFNKFDCPRSQARKQEACTKRLDWIFEKYKNLDRLLIAFPLILENFYQMSLLPHIYPLMHPVDQPEPFFCHLISKGALMFLNCSGCNYFHRRVGGTGITFLDRLKGLSQATQELFNYSVPEINFQDLTTIRLWNMNPELSPVIEQTLECSQLEESLTAQSPDSSSPKPNSKRNNRNRNKNRNRAAAKAQQPSRYDGPPFDLDEIQQNNPLLIKIIYDSPKSKVPKRSHSAPPLPKESKVSY